VGARDKTVRFWKVPEETQLVFRGGGATVSAASGQETQMTRIQMKKMGKAKAEGKAQMDSTDISKGL
jgi:ribosomal RNA-processing protein 9